MRISRWAISNLHCHSVFLVWRWQWPTTVNNLLSPLMECHSQVSARKRAVHEQIMKEYLAKWDWIWKFNIYTYVHETFPGIMKPWRRKCQSHGSRIRTAKTCSCYRNGTRQKHTITLLKETLEPIMASAAGTLHNLTSRKLIFIRTKITSMNQTGVTGLWMFQRWFFSAL